MITHFDEGPKRYNPTQLLAALELEPEMNRYARVADYIRSFEFYQLSTEDFTKLLPYALKNHAEMSEEVQWELVTLARKHRKDLIGSKAPADEARLDVLEREIDAARERMPFYFRWASDQEALRAAGQTGWGGCRVIQGLSGRL